MNERVPLSFLLTQNRDEVPPVEPTVPFAAIYGEAPKVVTAVLERTCVLAEPSDRYERISVRHELVLVDPAVIEWRVKTSDANGNRLQSPSGHGRMAQHRQPGSKSPWHASQSAPRPADAQAVRDESDKRARKSQEQVAATAQRELEVQRVVASRDAAEAVKRDASYASHIHQEEAVDPTDPTELEERPSTVLPTGQVERDQEAALEQGARYKPSRDEAARERFEEGVARLVREADEQLTEPSDVSVRSTGPTVLKFCPGCKEQKPKDQFPTGKGFFKCAECRASGVRSDATSAYKESVHRNQELSTENKKHCPACDTDKPLEAFNRNSTKGDGLQAICRQCQSDRWTAGATAVRTQKDEKAAAAAESPLKNQAAKPRRNGRPPLTFTELLNDLRQLSAYAAGLEKDNATLRAENEQFRDEQAGLYDELHAIVGGIKKATKERV